MNSDPRRVNTGTVTTTRAAAPPMTAHFHRNDQRTTGSYIFIEQAADRMRLLRADAADEHGVDHPTEPRRPELEAPHAREEHAQRGVERDHEARRHEHRERLGVGERLEQPPFLRLECQHREERHGDHEQREEAGRRDFPDRFQDDLVMSARRSVALCLLELLVRLFDDDDRRVDQLAHRDRDAAERHDVRRDPQSRGTG